MSLAKSKFVERGSKVVLPIAGFIVEQIEFRYCQMPGIQFSNEKDRFSLNISSSNIELSRGSNSLLEVRIDDIRSTPSIVMSLMLELISNEVEDAYADRQGELTIEFSNKLQLLVKPEVYEGWNFRGKNLSLIGADGSLI